MVRSSSLHTYGFRDPIHELMFVIPLMAHHPRGRYAQRVPEKVWYLRRLNLFDEMSDEDVLAISRELQMRTFASGQNCLRDGGERVYLLKSGRVRLYQLTPDGHELTTAVVVPGQLFGIGSLVGQAGSTQAEVLEESLICETGAQEFMMILAHHPVLMARVVMVMARQIFQLEEALESLAYKPVPVRLAELLLSLIPDSESDSGTIELPAYSQETLGQRIGATREAVARTLHDWREMGLVGRGRPLTIADVRALRRVSEGQRARPDSA